MVSSFHEWLASQGKTQWTVREIVIYAKRYGHVLLSDSGGGDASELMTLSPRNKHHAMTALANLAKYTGQYDKWMQMRQRYNLKCTSGTESLQSFNRFFNPDLSLETMLQRIKEMMRFLPHLWLK